MPDVITWGHSLRERIMNDKKSNYFSVLQLLKLNMSRFHLWKKCCWDMACMFMFWEDQKMYSTWLDPGTLDGQLSNRGPGPPSPAHPIYGMDKKKPLKNLWNPQYVSTKLWSTPWEETPNLSHFLGHNIVIVCFFFGNKHPWITSSFGVTPARHPHPSSYRRLEACTRSQTSQENPDLSKHRGTRPAGGAWWWRSSVGINSEPKSR